MQMRIVLCLAVALLLAAASGALAGSTISVTVTLQQLGVEVTPASWALGTMAPGGSQATTGDHFTATNAGNVAQDLFISAPATAPSGWTAGAASGTNVYVLEYDKGSGWVVIGSNTSLQASVAAAGTVPFDLQFTAPASDSTYNAGGETLTVSLSATAS